jgi:H+/Cl- antiporter ClcA
LWYWGLNSGPTPWATPPALFVFSIIKIGSHELFAQAGFELWSSWVARIVGMSHQCPAFFLFFLPFSLLFLSGLCYRSNTILLK